VARLLASLPSYVYSTTDDTLWVHLYVQGSLATVLGNGQRVALEQTTRYPWDGEVTLSVQTECTFTLKLRVPAWAEGATVNVNGEVVEGVKAGSYALLERDWRAGDTVELSLPMPVRYLESHPHVTENTGRVALARGPLLYCVEGADHAGTDVRDLVLPHDPALTADHQSKLLGGVTVLTGRAHKLEPSTWNGVLYRTVGETVGEAGTLAEATLMAVPYFAWANRDAAPMLVWLRRQS